MTGFLLAFVACLALMLPGRDAVRVAGLSEKLGPGPGLGLAIAVSTIAANSLAAWLGSLLVPSMPYAARQMFLAFALVLGAAELAFRRMPRIPAEPTRSVGAMLIVLLASQVTDGARLLVMAAALYSSQPLPAAAGGTLASGSIMVVALLAGGHWTSRVPIHACGWVLSVILMLSGLYTGLSARGLFG